MRNPHADRDVSRLQIQRGDGQQEQRELPPIEHSRHPSIRTFHLHLSSPFVLLKFGNKSSSLRSPPSQTRAGTGCITKCATPTGVETDTVHARLRIPQPQSLRDRLIEVLLDLNPLFRRLSGNDNDTQCRNPEDYGEECRHFRFYANQCLSLKSVKTLSQSRIITYFTNNRRAH